MMKLYEDKANNIWVTFSKGIFLNGRTPKSSKIDKWFAENCEIVGPPFYETPYEDHPKYSDL